MPKGVPNKRYTPEFKRMVVEAMKKEHLSIYAAMQEFGINDHKIIERWERIYWEEGPEGLAIEHRGRGSTGRPKKLPKAVEEDLLHRLGQGRVPLGVGYGQGGVRRISESSVHRCAGGLCGKAPRGPRGHRHSDDAALSNAAARRYYLP